MAVSLLSKSRPAEPLCKIAPDGEDDALAAFLALQSPGSVPAASSDPFEARWFHQLLLGEKVRYSPAHEAALEQALASQQPKVRLEAQDGTWEVNLTTQPFQARRDGALPHTVTRDASGKMDLETSETSGYVSFLRPTVI